MKFAKNVLTAFKLTITAKYMSSMGIHIRKKIKGANRVKFALKCDKPFRPYCLYTLL